MNEAHSRAIVYLLAAILCVMLFGASRFLTGLAWLGGIGAVLGVVFLAVAGATKLVGSLREEVTAAKAERKPWLWLLVAWPGIIGNFIVCGLAALRWLDGGIRYKDALSTVPYWWVPVVILLASVPVAAIESAHEWLPKVPGRTAALLRGWLRLAGSPIFGPIGHWQRIREARARGERIGAFSAGASLAWTFLIGVFLWWIAVMLPLVFVAVVVAESFR